MLHEVRPIAGCSSRRGCRAQTKTLNRHDILAKDGSDWSHDNHAGRREQHARTITVHEPDGEGQCLLM